MAYDKTIFNKASIIISKRRAKSLSDNEMNRQELFSKYPILKTLDSKLSAEGLRVVSEAVKGNYLKSSYEEFLEKTDKIKAEISTVLEENGLAADVLQDKFQCTKCEDTGFFQSKLCSCLREEMKRIQAIEVNNISPLTLSTFENFSLNFYKNENRDVMSKNLNHCKEYCQNFEFKNENLLFVGNTGLGKTHLSLAIANAIIASGKNVIYTSWLNILTVLEREKFQSYDSEENTLDSLITCDLLILDDLGAEFTTQFVSATLYNILNSRINYRRPIIINTNLSFKELGARYSDRIVSRIAGNFTTLRFTGEDIRIAKRRNQD